MTLPAIPMDETIEFLVGLLNTPSPTGDSEQAMAYVEQAVRDLPLIINRTLKGGLVLTWPGDAAHPRALTGHVDTLGAMVRQIKSNGRLELTGIGGFDWHSVEGEGCTVATAAGQHYRGSILPIMVSVHIHGAEVRTLERKQENYEVRLDVLTLDQEMTEALGIEVGDFVYFDPRVEVTNGFIRSRHLDDKAGVACIYGALLALHRAGLAPRYRLDVLISNYEEVGHGGAVGIPADAQELVTVDMAAVGEGQNSNEFSVGICAKDSGGPYDLGLRRRLEQLAGENNIAFKVDTYPNYGSDGEAALRAGADLRVALIGPGVDASHAYERTHRNSIEAVARLLVAYLLQD
ncbi:MAG TPA: M42 family metallopeptidase [Anaerolineae bacterium]|mgnify:CR=1 FL=1|nr:M42 family metallopeptidase [Anaerolineae bacterium]HQI86024.1 M42 family metallopeptidase [Anaerolineae bacterium]